MHKLKLLAFKLSVLLILGSSLCWGEQNRTYPTSAITQIRMDTYLDAIYTVYNSTYTVDISTWIPLISTWTWIGETRAKGYEWYLRGSTQTVTPTKGIRLGAINDQVYGYTWTMQGSSYVVVATSWSLKDYSNIIVEQAKYQFINEIIDKDVEQYMVWNGTDCPSGWKGWGSKIINGNTVPVTCQ